MGRASTQAERDHLINTALDLVVAGVDRVKVIEMLFAAAASIAVPQVNDSPCTSGRGLCRACFADSSDETYERVSTLYERSNARAH